MERAHISPDSHIMSESAASQVAGKAPASADLILEIDNLHHRYGQVVALKDVSLKVRRGEFLTLLGSSGSGKSTLLRMIAGLEMPTSVGAFTLAGQEMAHVPANHRNVSTVFQHYGLFPHLTVGQNVEYGLHVRKVPPDERRRQAEDMLKLVKLEDMYGRRIGELSGGQKQRVALARSLVLKPAILLLDEPLGALDEKLRLEMQIELLALHRTLGMTFIYVTHSQEEALTMSHRILLMSHGEIVQEGRPEDLFDRPVNRFAAEFMGMENIVAGMVTGIDGTLISATANGVALRGMWTGATPPSAGDQVAIAFRSEKVKLAKERAPRASETNVLEAKLKSRVYKGKYLDVVASCPLGDVRLRLWDDHVVLADQFKIEWRYANTVVIPLA